MATEPSRNTIIRVMLLLKFSPPTAIRPSSTANQAPKAVGIT